MNIKRLIRYIFFSLISFFVLTGSLPLAFLLYLTMFILLFLYNYFYVFLYQEKKNGIKAKQYNDIKIVKGVIS